MQCDARCKTLVQCVVSCEKLYCNASQNVNIWCKADMQLSEEDVKLYAGHMQLYAYGVRLVQFLQQSLKIWCIQLQGVKLCAANMQLCKVLCKM